MSEGFDYSEISQLFHIEVVKGLNSLNSNTGLAEVLSTINNENCFFGREASKSYLLIGLHAVNNK